MLEEIFSDPVMRQIKDDDPSAYLDLLREFETVKRNISPTKDSKVNITIPCSSLGKILGKDLPNVIRSSPYSNQIINRGDKIRVDASLMKSLFKPTIDRIILLIQNILKNKAASEVSQLLLVGGFSGCMLIQDAIMRNFIDKRVIFPEEAGLSVLKGAVLFGHRPEYVRSRVMRFSYGVELRVEFDPKLHNTNYLNDKYIPHKCDNIFEKIVEKDQEMEPGEKFIQSYFSTDPMQEAMTFQIYISTDKSPMYTDEPSCSKLGSAVITFPTPTKGEREIKAEYIFGNTEISMTAVDVTTGTQITASFDLI